MKLHDLPLGEEFIEVLKGGGIEELYPPQVKAVGAGVLDGKNLVLATPTASGKTLIAEFAISKALEKGGKAVYVVPLRALASEKYREFKKYERLGYRVAIQVGDLDSSKFRRRLDFDILIATSEKCDSILRSRADWFKDVGILVMDEVHLITTDRGPVYEILVSKFKRLFPEIQILALSATIGNASELADWLDAELVESDWRPVKLTESIVVGRDKLKEMEMIIRKSVREGGQVLVFVSTRRSAESVAEKLSEKKFASRNKKLEELKKLVLTSLPSPTTQCERLAKCVGKGTAFHHAAITNEQKTLVEDAFKEGLIKVITATPTLAFGINLPSRVVIIRDMKRYTGYGSEYIPVLEYKQMIGRAGRPKYDDSGEAVIISTTNDERDFLMENYVMGEPEPIYSKLGVEPVLRFHVLAAIASDFTKEQEKLLEFLKSTFFGYQKETGVEFEGYEVHEIEGEFGVYGKKEKFEDLVNRVVYELKDWGFINIIEKRDKNFLLPTNLGKRISELYIDPQTAHSYITILGEAEKDDYFPDLGVLEMLCEASEMPLLWINRWEEGPLFSEIKSREDELLRDSDAAHADPRFYERFKTAKIFYDWISEFSEKDMHEKYRIGPGLLHQKLEIARWLSYSASEMAKLLELKNSFRELKKMETRIRYGIKEELIPLIGVKGIGRVRARRLFRAGYKNMIDLKEADVKSLTKVLESEKIAKKVKDQVY